MASASRSASPDFSCKFSSWGFVVGFSFSLFLRAEFEFPTLLIGRKDTIIVVSYICLKGCQTIMAIQGAWKQSSVFYDCQFLEDCFFCNFLRWSDATEAGVSPLPPAFPRAAEKSTTMATRGRRGVGPTRGDESAGGSQAPAQQAQD
ncbi:hypothetical protein Taro_036573 [Colocasia esculenta]|uniref:Uncharacterized protein n=1 Tax=Colocasia esculenta TaxID=4460 RepID=A0A843VXW8_COLES|nr:hypothetical protein [Colocasia esculenta]